MAHLALTETLEFSRAVQRAVDLTDIEDTLIVATADHSHVFTIAGYASYDTSILGNTELIIVMNINMGY